MGLRQDAILLLIADAPLSLPLPRNGETQHLPPGSSQQWINDVFNQIPIAAINFGINALERLSQ